MDAAEETRDSRLCACCLEARARPERTTSLRCVRHSTPARPWQTSSAQPRALLHSGKVKSALNVRWRLIVHSALLFILLRPGFCEASCRIGDPLYGYLPNVPNKQLDLQADTPASDCAEACCHRRGQCDLAWVVEGGCFHARCLGEEDCKPVADSTLDSRLYVVERSQQAKKKGGVITCDVSSEIDECPAREYCQFGYCICQPYTIRNPQSGQCEYPVFSQRRFRYLEGKPPLLKRLKREGSSPTPISPLADSTPTVGPQTAPETTPIATATPTPLNTTPGATPLPASPFPASSAGPTQPITTPANNLPTPIPGEAATNPTPPVTSGQGQGGGPVVTGVTSSSVHTENGVEGSGHQGDSQTPVSTKDTDSPNTTGTPTVRAGEPTHGGATPADGGDQTAARTDTGLEEKSKVPQRPSVSPTTAEPTVSKLTVSAGKDRSLQLPDEDGVKLIAFVIPEEPPDGPPYSYNWQVLDSPGGSRPGTMVGLHEKELQLNQLSAGVYRFKVEVQGEGSFGSVTVNVTVLPPPRVNVPPKAVVTPTNQDVILPNPDTFLDGSDSTDDDKIVSYQWEEVEGPVRETKITGDTQTLKLTDLVPGNYVIRLTVTDSDGVTDSALANVTVKEETDNPPIAKAGKDVIIKLPINSAVLYGNSSFDDHPGLVYEWSKVSGPVADMSGSSSAILHLNNLEEGSYVFHLTVTDSKGHKDSDEATVIVKPENNLPPTADAGPDKELSLPDDSTTLNGKGSKDDLAVTSYLWEKVSGPNEPEIEDSERDIATVSGLVAGMYVFKLTVGDKQGATDSDTVQVVVKKEINNPPVAVAGPDVTIQLPCNVVELDGSMSSDDKGIVSYDWKRDPKSPAAGTAVGNSAHEAMLKLTGLVAGSYHITLNVTDAKGASDTDKVIVTVMADPHRLNLVEITFDVPVSKFKEQDKIDMTRSLAVLLSVRDEDISIQQVFQTPNEQLQVIFYAHNATSNSAIPGPTVVKILSHKKLSSETDLLKFRVLEVDTMICQKNCSGHGECNPYTRLCMCESFWMENYIRRWFGDGESNCDWSILYVIIVACVVAVAFGALFWICICCVKRSRRKVKRRRRYNLLSQDLDGTESMEMLPKNGNEPVSEPTKNSNGSVLDKLTDKGSFQGKQSSSIMISESDDDTDEETTLFDSKKRVVKNGKANGSVVGSQSRKKRPFPLISSRTEKL